LFRRRRCVGGDVVGQWAAVRFVGKEHSSVEPSGRPKSARSTP